MTKLGAEVSFSDVFTQENGFLYMILGKTLNCRSNMFIIRFSRNIVGFFRLKNQWMRITREFANQCKRQCNVQTCEDHREKLAVSHTRPPGLARPSRETALRPMVMNPSSTLTRFSNPRKGWGSKT